MNIGIIGAGNLGTGLAEQLVKKGHAVMLSFSEDAAKLRQSAGSVGVKEGTPAEAAAFGNVIVLATPWTVTADAVKQIGVRPDDSHPAVRRSPALREDSPWRLAVRHICLWRRCGSAEGDCIASRRYWGRSGQRWGPMNLARYTEPAAMLLVQLAYVHGFGARIGLTLLRDTSQHAAKQAMP